MDIIAYRILEQLRQDRYLPSSQLAEHIHVSERTVRNRMKELSEELPQYGANLIAKPKYGYKGTSADKKEKPEGVVMSCPFCGEAFVRRNNRAKTCGSDKCEKARKAMNQRNSRKKRKILAQQSK